MSRVLDIFRFSLGTLTAIPVRPPSTVSRSVTIPAIALAPMAVAPLGALVALVLWAGREAGLASLPVAALAVASLALGSRAFHLDGLSDTADALTCSYDAERSLEVMKRGDAGPAGASAIALVLAIQIGALTTLMTLPWGPLLAGSIVCASRGVGILMSSRHIASARDSGLASTYASTAPTSLVVTVWLGIAAILMLVLELAGLPWWRAWPCLAAALATSIWLIRRARLRFGGVAGDVYGAGIEVALAVMLLSLT